MRERIQKEVERLKSTEVSISQELNAVENSIRQTVVDASGSVDAALPEPLVAQAVTDVTVPPSPDRQPPTP